MHVYRLTCVFCSVTNEERTLNRMSRVDQEEDSRSCLCDSRPTKLAIDRSWSSEFWKTKVCV
jgi:hypothetical protein